MQYKDLHALIRNSQSSRRYFLSLPVSLQMELHQYNHVIRTANDLHRQIQCIQKYNRQVEISQMLF